jgi:hypothetical protein
MPMHPSLRKKKHFFLKSPPVNLPYAWFNVILNCTTLILNMGLNLQQMKCSVSTTNSRASQVLCYFNTARPREWWVGFCFLVFL